MFWIGLEVLKDMKNEYNIHSCVELAPTLCIGLALVVLLGGLLGVW